VRFPTGGTAREGEGTPFRSPRFGEIPKPTVKSG